MSGPDRAHSSFSSIWLMNTNEPNSQLITEQNQNEDLTQQELRRVTGFFELLKKIDKRIQVTKKYRNESNQRSTSNANKTN